MMELRGLEKVVPQTHIHAHNDNESDQPLLRSLSRGIAYIEVDIWLKDGILYAQHGRPYIINPNKKFTITYLDPLFAYFKKNGTIYHCDTHHLTLVLDIKTAPKITYHAILDVLKPYYSMISHWENHNQIPKPVSILLSGNSTLEIIQNQFERWVQVDGRISDLGQNHAPSIVPTISEKYSKVLGWHPFSEFPSVKKLENLRSITKQVHEEGKLFRLWKIPEDKAVVKLLMENGVDIVSLDDLGVGF